MRRGFCLAGFLLAEGNRGWAFCLPGKTGVRRGHTPGNNRVLARLGKDTNRVSAQPRVRARHGEERDTVRDLLAAGALEKPRSRAQLFKRFCALGNGWPHNLHIHGSLARAFALPQGTRGGLSACPGKQESGVGTRPEITACLRGWEKTQTGCSAQPRVRARLGKGTNPVRDLLTAGAPQARDFCLLRKTEARRGPAPGTSRVRARLGKDTNRVRVLLTAGVRACETRGRKRHGARIARRRRANCSPQVRRCAGELGKGEL